MIDAALLEFPVYVVTLNRRLPCECRACELGPLLHCVCRYRSCFVRNSDQCMLDGCDNCSATLFDSPLWFLLWSRYRYRYTKACRYNWDSAGSLGWPIPMLKCKYIFRIEYTEAILSNSTRKLLWFEITKKMLISVEKKKQVYCVINYNFWHTFVPYSSQLGAEYCDESVCEFVCFCVCLSASITPELHVWSSANFCAWCLLYRRRSVLHWQHWVCRTLCTSVSWFSKYLTTILRLPYDNAKLTIDLRRTSNLPNILRRTQAVLRYDSLAKSQDRLR